MKGKLLVGLNANIMGVICKLVCIHTGRRDLDATGEVDVVVA